MPSGNACNDPRISPLQLHVSRCLARNMNPYLQKLQSYPFDKLNRLIEHQSHERDLSPISLAVGEPRHATPECILNAYTENLTLLNRYPTTRGSLALRSAFASWLARRFALPGDVIREDRNVLPVNGTREALFACAQFVIDPIRNPVVLIPNPFYQIYEGAALLAGAQPVYYDGEVVAGDIPALWALEDAVWNRVQLVYLCTPGNPSGQLAPQATLQKLVEYSKRYKFTIASDECYSEIYPPNCPPPMGLLPVCQSAGDDTLQNCLAFYSLSKRSNAPGMRSAFVAGDARLIKKFLQYRTYHGCTLSLPVQAASIAAWSDENHVIKNRELYQEKFVAVRKVLEDALPCEQPQAGFYLWPELAMDDQEFTRLLYSKKNVLTLPGSYLARTVAKYNPGQARVRLALVATKEECLHAAARIRDFLLEISE